MGAWTVATARDWPDCTFVSNVLVPVGRVSECPQVGYDLMNVQIPLWVLEDDVAARIEWVHGNLCVASPLDLVVVQPCPMT